MTPRCAFLLLSLLNVFPHHAHCEDYVYETEHSQIIVKARVTSVTSLFSSGGIAAPGKTVTKTYLTKIAMIPSETLKAPSGIPLPRSITYYTKHSVTLDEKTHLPILRIEHAPNNLDMIVADINISKEYIFFLTKDLGQLNDLAEMKMLPREWKLSEGTPLLVFSDERMRKVNEAIHSANLNTN